MESNSQTITLAGETLTEADIPKSPMFFTVAGDKYHRDGLWFSPCAYHINTSTWSNDETFPLALDSLDDLTSDYRSLIAAVARCWFLDMAEERKAIMRVMENNTKSVFNQSGYVREEHDMNIYLASAAKWARIGKGAKG